MGNNSASILARLKNESIKRGIPNQQMITLFLQEEFSRRLGKSKYIDKFVLKGASFEELSVEKVIREIIEIDNIDIIN